MLSKLSLAAGASLMILASVASANPNGATVAQGSANVTGQGTSNVTVYQATPKAVINWDSFSIGAGEATTFVQPNASAVTLNRVVGADPSAILGNLSANGTVVLVNRNGIVFGSTARVDVGGLVATTHDIADSAFMADGALRFDQSGNPDASVVNKGIISVRNAGLAAFVAPHVVNDGVITANFGRVTLGSAKAFTLDLYGDDLISFALGDEVSASVMGPDASPVKALVDNSGSIIANGASCFADRAM
jgi:filamentous hemagglutinin family protein